MFLLMGHSPDFCRENSQAFFVELYFFFCFFSSSSSFFWGWVGGGGVVVLLLFLYCSCSVAMEC